MSTNQQDPFHLSLYTAPGGRHNFMNHFMISIGGLLFEMVRAAAVRVQRHKCECILLTHAASGKNFGMDTNYQKVDAFAPVADWYERFNMSEYMSAPMEHVLLPKDRPGYYDEDVPA